MSSNKYDNFTLPSVVACRPFPADVKTPRRGTGLVLTTQKADLCALEAVWGNLDLMMGGNTAAVVRVRPRDQVFVRATRCIQDWASEVFMGPSDETGKLVEFILVPITEIVLVQRCAASS